VLQNRPAAQELTHSITVPHLTPTPLSLLCPASPSNTGDKLRAAIRSALVSFIPLFDGPEYDPAVTRILEQRVAVLERREVMHKLDHDH